MSREQGNEVRLVSEDEYRLRVPKVPREMINVFAVDIENGQYGYSSLVIDTVLAYVELQETLSTFDALRLSPNFISRFPDSFKEKLGDNLYPGIPLSRLEIPTTDKVIVTEFIAAEEATRAFPDASVEVWVDENIQKDLQSFGINSSAGLQKVDYRLLSLDAKRYLLSTMEYQRYQVQQILLAREMYPDGVEPLRPLFSFGKREIEEKITFDTLYDLNLQYSEANRNVNDPTYQIISKMFANIENNENTKAKKTSADTGEVQDPEPSVEEEIDLDEKIRIINEERRKRDKELPYGFDPEVYRKTKWWKDEYRGWNLPVMRAMEEYLRPQYKGKTLYEILGAQTDAERDEILASFWRRQGNKRIDLGEEGWVEHNLYLVSDGNLELHVWDSLYSERGKSRVTGELDHHMDVAIVDQAVQWITEERDDVRSARKRWNEKEFPEEVIVESVFAKTVGAPLRSKEGIDGSPEWFEEALDAEEKLYENFPLEYRPGRTMVEALSFVRPQNPSNLLESYFVGSSNMIERYRSLITTPTELYLQLGLTPHATNADVRKAYMQIAKETGILHTDREAEHDQETWEMKKREFIRATEAYKILSKGVRGNNPVTSLGKLSMYFEKDEEITT